MVMAGLIFKKIIPIALLVLGLISLVYFVYAKHEQENTVIEILEAYKANDLNKLEKLACEPDETNDTSTKNKAAVLYETLKRSNSEIVFTTRYDFPYTNTFYKEKDKELAFVVTSYRLFTNHACFYQGAG